VESSTGTWLDGGFGFWVIESDSAMIGTVGFRESSWQPGVCELVYSVEPDWWGKGIATEVARAALTWAFVTHHWPKIVGATDTLNVASARVLERVGMRLVRAGTFEPGLPTLFFEISISGQ